MVISSEFRMGEFGDGDNREDALLGAILASFRYSGEHLPDRRCLYSMEKYTVYFSMRNSGEMTRKTKPTLETEEHPMVI